MALNIAIIGAGPAGCTLARILQVSDTSTPITVTIFEAEASFNARSQGGSLDLHETTGLAALRRAGLFEQFEQHARYDGEAFTLCDKNFKQYVRMNGSSGKSKTGRPEIDRPALREILYQSLKEGTVQWGKKVVRIAAEDGSDDRTIEFADGSTASGFDLVVGADGAWSRVRPLLSCVQPYYSGIAGHSLRITAPENKHPELYALVNRGSMFAFSDCKSLMAQQMGDGSLNVATWSAQPADWRAAFNDVHSGAEVRKNAIETLYADWDSRLMDLIRASDDDDVVPRDLYMLPVGHSWEHKQGLTLLGDAAHLMTPFAGEGVNLAMQDALALADAIIVAAGASSPQRDLDERVAAFERDMFVRATATQQLTVDLMEMKFTPAGISRSTMAEYVARALEGPRVDGQMVWKHRFVTRPLIKTWFGVFGSIRA